MTRPSVLIPLLVGVACGLVVICGLAVAVVGVKPSSAASPDYRVVSTGGLQYEAMLGRPLDPQDPVDRAIMAGLPAREQHVARGDLLFGAFLAVSNTGARPIQSPDRIELRDTSGRVYAPLRLADRNPYAYSARVIPQHTRTPQAGTPAADNLAATGLLLVFQIPSNAYEGGGLELLIHPRSGGGAASLVI